MRKLAFQFDAETIHDFTIHTLERFPSLAQFWNQDINYDLGLETSIGKIHFPIGLAAGLDKNARCLDFFSQIGFGFLEVGTVTYLPQRGNDRPRLWRLQDQESLQNRMGFNNDGPDALVANIAKWRVRNSQSHCKIGINLGKNKETPAHLAAQDYYNLYSCCHSVADYLVINVSSPNTPGLRDLQNESAMVEILDGLKSLREKFPKPLFIKISPDLGHDALEMMVSFGQRFKLAGLIATNTTIREELGPGGISGKLLKEKSAETRNFLLQASQDTGLEIIGVGGISSFEDLWDFWRHGGKMAQVYTGLIYQGPGMLNNLQIQILQAMKKMGAESLSVMLSDWRQLPEKI